MNLYALKIKKMLALPVVMMVMCMIIACMEAPLFLR